MLKRLINFLFVHPAGAAATAKVICDANKCTLCGKCQRFCRTKAITVDNRSWLYYSYRCNRCRHCVRYCPVGALKFAEGE
jgi:energy-converting hydrogenase B subunit K